MHNDSNEIDLNTNMKVIICKIPFIALIKGPQSIPVQTQMLYFGVQIWLQLQWFCIPKPLSLSNTV